MTDVEEPTANIDPTIDAECPAQLAERGIVWVCAPRIEEGWEEVQSVRKAAGAGVGECGEASGKKASIDEALHWGNQGVVRNAEVCFAVTSPDSLLRLLACGWLVGWCCLFCDNANRSPGLSLSCPPFFLDTLRHRLATCIRIMLHSLHYQVPFSPSVRGCSNHVQRTNRHYIITSLTLSTQDLKAFTQVVLSSPGDIKESMSKPCRAD